MQISGIGILDNFCDLGGDSMAATQLALCIKERLATPVSSELFLENASVKSFADWIGGDTGARTVLPLRPGDQGTPFFLFHGGRGHVFEYADLVSKLSCDRAIFGLQRGSKEKAAEGFDRLQDLASHYVREIRNVQPHGPYLLGEQCNGGLLAFEAAQRLRQIGERVELLVLLDTAFPNGMLRRLGLRLLPARHWRRWRLLNNRERLSYLVQRASFIFRSAAGALGRLSEPTGDSESRMADAVDVYDSLAAKYRPKGYAGKMALVCVGPVHAQHGWMAVAKHGLDLVELTERDVGAHPTDPAHVDELAPILDGLLEQAAR